jgi:hypothetical protein
MAVRCRRSRWSRGTVGLSEAETQLRHSGNRCRKTALRVANMSGNLGYSVEKQPVCGARISHQRNGCDLRTCGLKVVTSLPDIDLVRSIDQSESQRIKRSTDAPGFRIRYDMTGHKLINGRYSVLSKSYCHYRMPDDIRYDQPQLLPSKPTPMAARARRISFPRSSDPAIRRLVKQTRSLNASCSDKDDTPE